MVILPSSGVSFHHQPGLLDEKEDVKPVAPVSIKDNPSVLVVEDNLVNLQLLTLYIQNSCRAYSALDGLSAIERAREKQFDLILMDINLGPGTDGIQAMLEIRKLSGYQNIPIVALTGYASIGDRDRLISLGFSEYLSKPVMKDVLLGLIADLTKA